MLHKSGVYFLWAYPFSVYWWNLSYYGNPTPIDYVFYWSGFLAFSSRIAAWSKKRMAKIQKDTTVDGAPAAVKVTGGLLVAIGLVASATGNYWQAPVTAFLTAPQWSENLMWSAIWFRKKSNT